ncbi:MAG TPA: HAD family hydrolase [Gemmatimonadales bacterium]|nr:HAD family hydrolase [Gemmatimonadales bacterium]
MSRRRAAFLDRDGTLIEDLHYLRDAAAVRLLPGVAAAIRMLNDAAILAVVATNQSGIARGRLSEAEYRATQRRLDELLAEEGARLDGHYHCPHLPEITGPCDCRKPGPGLYREAARDLDIDLAASWWIGDRLRDLAAARLFGGHGALLLTGAGREEALLPDARSWVIVPDLETAAGRMVGQGEAG